MQFVFDPYTVTGLSNKKINKTVSTDTTYKLDSIFDVMNYLKIHNTGTDEDIANIQYFLNRQDKSKYDFYDVMREHP